MPAGVSSHLPSRQKRVSIPPYRAAKKAYFLACSGLGTTQTCNPLGSTSR